MSFFKGQYSIPINKDIDEIVFYGKWLEFLKNTSNDQDREVKMLMREYGMNPKVTNDKIKMCLNMSLNYVSPDLYDALISIGCNEADVPDWSCEFSSLEDGLSSVLFQV